MLEYAVTKQFEEDVADVLAIIRILEDKRAEVMENVGVGYFIHDWQECRNHVSRMIVEDPRYKAVKASQTARFASWQVKRVGKRGGWTS